MASLAEKYGFRLLVENDIGYWCDTGDNTAKLLEEINSRALIAAWDPANAFASGEIPYPYGFLAVRKYIAIVHVRDARLLHNRQIQWVPVGMGEIDWPGQLQALAKMDIPYLTIETQCQPLYECTRSNVEQLQNLFYENYSNEGFMIR